jgi:acetyltransferase-like isoleucine patch superfamily enzyme
MTKLLFQCLILCFPWRLRRRLLSSVCGFRIDASARIGRSIILAKQLIMEKGAEIQSLTLCKSIDLLHLGEGASIGAANYITGFSVSDVEYFQSSDPRRCELILERNATITSRHYIDCNGGVVLAEYATLAGVRSQLLSHSVDVYTNTMSARPVSVGRYCFVGTGCILLPGSALPDYSVLGAGAVLNKSYRETHRLYVGSPARCVKELDPDRVQYFKRQARQVF